MKLKSPSEGKTNPPRLLIAEDDTTLARALADYFTAEGFSCRICYTVDTAKEVLQFWQPDFMIVELLLPHSNGLILLKQIQSKAPASRPRVIVTSKNGVKSGVETVKRAGADGFLVKPFKFREVHALIDPDWARAQVKAFNLTKKVEKTTGPADPVTQAMINELNLINLFLKQATDPRAPSENLFNLMRMVSLKVRAIRCSFVRCLNADTGIVLASNDDRSVRGLTISLTNYPEIREVMRTSQALLIPQVRSSALMAPVRSLLLEARFETLAVFPIFLEGRFFGVTSVRMAERDPSELIYIDRFGQVAAQIISISIPSALRPLKAS